MATLKISSYFGLSDPGTHFDFWERGIGRLLPTKLGEAHLFPYSGERIGVTDDSFDIAYCQPWGIPDRRPARFVYAFLSDHRFHEKQIAEWIWGYRWDWILAE